MPKLFIIADDLTGANDVGVQFAKQGIPSFVTLDAACDFGALFREFEVVVFDSESRHIGPEAARDRVREAARRAGHAGADHFYKKTDSTLRGNIGAELQGLLEAVGGRSIGFVPALPELGRTTRGGMQFVHGQLLHETTFAKDPRNPMNESGVAAVLGKQTTLPVTVVRGSDRADLKALPDGIAVFDAETQADFRDIAAVLHRLGSLRTLSGTAGFAEFPPEFIPFRKLPHAESVFKAPLLVVNGSLNPVSLRQMAFAGQQGFATVRLPPEILVREEGPESVLADRLLEEIAAHLGRGRNTLLQSIAGPNDLPSYMEAAARLSLETSSAHERVAECSGRFVARLLGRTPLTQLVVFGGDTLVGLCRAAGWAGFSPRSEVFPGVTVAQAAGAAGLLVISKAGGFGGESLLPELRDALFEPTSR